MDCNLPCNRYSEITVLVQTFVRSVYNWSKLEHKNVLPFLGYFVEGGEYPMLVSPWMENGSLLAYMDKVPKGTSTILMVRTTCTTRLT